MNYKTTLWLLALVLLAGAAVWISGNHAPPADPTPAGRAADVEEGKSVFSANDLPTSDVDSVALTSNGRNVVFTRAGSDWYQTQPIRFPMNTWAIQKIVDDAARLRYTDKFTPGRGGGPTLAQAELEKPGTVLTFHLGGDKPATRVVKLGRRTVTGRGFAMIDNDPAIYLVDDTLHHTMQDQKVESWRKRTFDSPTEGTARRITLTQGETTVDMVKNDGRWSLSGGNTGRVNVQSVTSLLDKVTSLYAADFVAETPYKAADYGLDKPSLVITITGGIEAPPPPPFGSAKAPPPSTQPAPVRTTIIRVGGPVDFEKSAYFATWADDKTQPGEGATVFTLASSSVDHYRRTANEVRDPHLVVTGEPNVRELTVAARNRPVLRLTRQPEGWAFGDPKPPFEADGGDVSKLVTLITETSAESFLTGAALDKALASAGEPLLTLSVAAVGQSTPEVVRFYNIPSPQGGEERLAIRNDEKVGHVLSVQTAEPMFVTADMLRDRTLLHTRLRDILRLTVVQSDGVTLSFEQAQAAATAPSTPGGAAKPDEDAELVKPWKFVGKDGVETKSLAVLLRLLAPLRVDAWLPEDSPRPTTNITVTIETFSGQRHILRLDTATGQGLMEGSKTPFRVPQQLALLLNSELRNRAMLSLNAQDIQALEIGEPVAGSADLHWLRLERGPSGQFVPMAKVSLNLATVSKMVDSLAGLRTLRWLASAPPTPPARVIKVFLDDERTFEIVLTSATGGLPAAVVNPGGRAGMIPKERFDRLKADVLAMPTHSGDEPPQAPEMPLTPER
ncbi:MAG: DUF4340 domain-containing protein [Planctomycetes bacterium]|nr:DUF4340 domain-containing protein [Planctomycetota bacterium]